MHLLRAVLTCLARRQGVSFYYFHVLANLTVDYAYWYDFYSANRIKVNVGAENTKVAQVLALDAVGAVSTGYQQSVANIIYPTTILSAGQDVQFVFSSIFEELWRGLEIPTGTFVHTGLMFDSAVYCATHYSSVFAG
ncbi:MAG: hypothetical protein IIA50_02720 [Bacteroidetes bacterium]|nr:hypothetical protein [Bacteroidota bacterium]